MTHPQPSETKLAGPRPYDLLLLDFGGVCLLNPVELHHVAEAKLGLPPGTFTWLGPLDPPSDPLWRELTAGAELRERDYWRARAAEVGAAGGRSLSLEDYMRLIYWPPSDELIRPGCAEVVTAALGAGIGVSILTNDLRTFHGSEWEAGISVLAQVDRVFDCSDLGILKPDRRAFTWALSETGHDPYRVLFVDDQPLSVEGALAVGIDALWFDISQPAACWLDIAHRLGLEEASGEGR
ncbi:MAG: hypothetical protein OEV40_14030 [Acidimicrobiia bacterium]|nr:hypothetical protein [Acidimicrobiia bacterium]